MLCPLPSRTNPQGSPRTPRKSEKKEVQLIDFKRANNVAIGLAQFKHFGGHDNLFRAVIELDSANLSHEKLGNLQAMLPTTSELQLVKQYKGG